MTEKPQVDFEEAVKASGMPVTEEEIRDRFNAIATEEGIITNTSRMSPFWRLVTAIVTAPVMWLKEVLISTVLANMFVATASGSMLRLLAWAVNITPKPASAAQGVIRFYKEDASAVVTVKAGTVIQTERINGRVYDRIFFEHEAPRGPGTANAYLLLDSGVASAPFVDAVNDYINTQGHHGHGDDMQCYAMPETLHDLAVTVWVRNLNNISDDEQKRLKDGIENLIRCAFRENTDYDVRRTWPYSRFSFSQLGREIHKNFPVTESLNFSLDDIASELNVPRLKSLVVSIENE
ncbi:baseplate J/gp47 family protein [Salmonella enterica]|nr:baseplate J/gp47 family protein [Salmonella enterica]